MDWLTFTAQWLHVLFSILWFGGALTTNFIFIPSTARLPLEQQRQVTGLYGAIAGPILTFAGLASIVLGAIRGSVFGPVQSLESLLTPYGLTWLVAIVIGAATFAWGKKVIEPGIHRMNTIPISDAVLPDGRPSPALFVAIDGVRRAGMIELLGFGAILTTMVLLRFGL